VLDTATQQPRKLIDQPPSATFFAWSPNGKYLAFVQTGQTIQEAKNFVIMKVDSGEIAETRSFFWPDMSIPPDSPANDLDIQFLPSQYDFSSCAHTRISSQ
jgi:Tol biopolymer transport system component